MSEKRVPELRFKGFDDAWEQRLSLCQIIYPRKHGMLLRCASTVLRIH